LNPSKSQNECSIYFGGFVVNISVKDVTEARAESLRQRAARNHRGLQGELIAIIEQAVQGKTLSDGTAATKKYSLAPLSAMTARAIASRVLAGRRLSRSVSRQRLNIPSLYMALRWPWKSFVKIGTRNEPDFRPGLTFASSFSPSLER
jgi:plasmid stability protein